MEQTFLTSHAVALLAIYRQPDIRIRDLAERLRVTERTAQAIVGDLARAGYVVKERAGRRNNYRIVADRPLRLPRVGSETRVGYLIEKLAELTSESAR